MTELLCTTTLLYTDYAAWDHLWVWEGGLPVNIKWHFSNETAKIPLTPANCGGVVYTQNCERRRTAGVGKKIF